MAKCPRSSNSGTTVYKRHKYKNGVCVKCKAIQSEQLAELAKRREQRNKLKLAKRAAA
jgi:hypothetical protein